MADLRAEAPFAGRAPLEAGGVTLAPLDAGALTLVMPYRGQSGAVGAALGADLPPPGKWTRRGDSGCVAWFGREAWLVMGGDPVPPGLPAAVTDQSDGWAALSLAGDSAVDVLARLVPMDLRAAAFPPGSAARTELQHMAVAILCTGAARFEILGFRSMAATLWHDLAHAARGVAARRGG